MGPRFWPVGSGIDDPDYGEFPLKAFLGLEIEDGEPGQAEAWLDVGDDHMNPNGGEVRPRARVQVLHAGRRIVHLDGRVFVDGEEKPVAAVSGSFAVLGG